MQSARALLGLARRLSGGVGIAVVVSCADRRPPPNQPPLTVDVVNSPPASASAVTGAGEGTTIDPFTQQVVEAETARAIEQERASEVTGLVLDPHTGAVLALAGANTARAPRAPGAPLEALLVAAALEQRAVRIDESIDCEQGERIFPAGQRMRDTGKYGTLTVREILAVSSNVGATKIFDRLGESAARSTFDALGFSRGIIVGDGIADPAALPPSFPGNTIAGANVALGQGGVRIAPLHLAAAYAALANDGVYVPPSSSCGAGPTGERRVFRSEVAREMLGMLEFAVSSESSKGAAARIAGVRVGGQTGTANLPGGHSSYASFVGVAPLDAPRFVVLVGLVSEHGSGGKVAAPVFARIVARLLAHGGGAACRSATAVPVAPDGWVGRCKARLEGARRALGQSWNLFAPSAFESSAEGVSLEVESSGAGDRAPSDRTRFSVVVRSSDDGIKETAWESETWSAASVVHLTRRHRGLFARLESGAAKAADHERFVRGFRSAVDECLEDGPASTPTHAR